MSGMFSEMLLNHPLFFLSPLCSLCSQQDPHSLTALLDNWVNFVSTCVGEQDKQAVEMSTWNTLKMIWLT